MREFLSRHEYERYLLLSNIVSDEGRGRAWLRSTLNEHSLERYMHMVVSENTLLKKFYNDDAFIRDDERSSMLPMMAAGRNPHSEKKNEPHEGEIDSKKSLFFYWKIFVFRGQNLF